MRLRILSDLHLEFHHDGGDGFVRSLTADPDEVLILAGDIGVGAGLLSAIAALCAKWRRVVFVAGNHEYYHHSPAEVHDILRECERRHAGFHWLDNGCLTLDGQRFLGGTLWFSEAAGQEPGRWGLSDFEAIEDFEPWVYRDHERTVALLNRELCRTDVVVTHQLPSQACVAPKWSKSPLNPFFVHDLCIEI